jgi:hemerythrin-like metal-binding protein
MGLVWDETFVLGIDEIDLQHRSIVEHFTKFSEAVQDGSAKEVLADLADFLVEYAQMHFATEETYMQKYNYPRIDEQRHEHEEFTLDALELRKRIEEEGASRELSIALTGRMVRWVIQHIRKHDRDMVNFVKERMAEELKAV